MSDCRSASVVSLPAEGGGKRAIDFYIKRSLMRLGGWAWSKAYEVGGDQSLDFSGFQALGLTYCHGVQLSV